MRRLAAFAIGILLAVFPLRTTLALPTATPAATPTATPAATAITATSTPLPTASQTPSPTATSSPIPSPTLAPVRVAVGAPWKLYQGEVVSMEIIFENEELGLEWEGWLRYDSLTPEICTVDADGLVTCLQEGDGQILVTIEGGELLGMTEAGELDLAAVAKDHELLIPVKILPPRTIKQAAISGTNALIYRYPDAASDYYAIAPLGTMVDFDSNMMIVSGFLEVLHHGKPAYIRMSSISFAVEKLEASLKAPLVLQVAIKGGRLNVRNAPNGPVVARLKNGTTVTVIDVSNPQWYQLENGNFISSAFVKTAE